MNWNGRHYLKECLQSLLKQNFKDFEIILVDNGSTDDSVPFVHDHFPSVHIVKLNENRGFCGGNNIGFHYARGKYIALLNNDTQADPNWLEELVVALDSRKDIGFCASKILLYSNKGTVDTCGDYYSLLGVAGKIGHLESADEYNDSIEVFGACGAAVIYKREMLNEIGMFDEDFFLAYEDVDLSFRAQLYGYRCLFVPTAIIYHHLSASIGEYSDSYVYYGQRNLEYVYIKNMPARLLLRSLPSHLLYNILALFYFAGKRKGRPFLKAKLHAIDLLHKMLAKRREIQKQRRIGVSEIKSKLKLNGLTQKIRIKLE